MRKLLNTLYITIPDAYISKDGLNVVISVKQEELLRVPIHNIESIICFSYMGVSPGVMKLCADSNVSLTFLSPTGRYIGRFHGPQKGNVLLRKRQYECFQNEDFSLKLSRLIIASKIHNYRAVLMRHLHNYGDNLNVDAIVNHLKLSKERSLITNSKDQLRGIEGDAANAYFSVLKYLILNQNQFFYFNGRNKRPPRDGVNVLLSFIYTMIANEIVGALECVGLDPYLGFFHTIRPGRASLALDIMEEFRAYLGDRFVLSLINRLQIQPSDFIRQTEDSMVLTDAGRKTLLGAWQNRKREEITHPYLGEKVPIGLLPFVQAQLLARYLRSDIDNYPVFLIK
ncbi:MAG: type I-C CRISPR-associated endonuclease Cas1c [Bacteroidales bacterium]|nr:type I-C CRISPR-associated endonuclease Cas1c [Bacteroidales bacterium]